MTITPDGIRAAAEREKEFHPTRPNGSKITAWERRAVTLEATVDEINQLSDELETIKADVAEAKAALEALKSRPF